MSENEVVLIVDDEPDFTRGLARLLAARLPGVTALTSQNADEALEAFARVKVGAVLTDLRMPGKSGLDLLDLLRQSDPDVSVVLMTAYGSIETAVQALKSGAYDFLTKPVDHDVLARVTAKALERTRLLRENALLASRLTACNLPGQLVGESPAMLRLKETIAAVAASGYTVLIRGESGTGKELVARSIHGLSPRARGPLVAVNCPAIPENLLESELFGHVKGAFTGADKPRKGLFVNAAGGSLLLDEIGDIPPHIQTKLLRVLQEREIRPVGASRSVAVDARILATTNADLEAKIAAKAFREDLFYRLNVLTVAVPPLRERREDVPLLVRHFVARTCGELGLPQKDVDPSVLADLAARPWPGNVRELLNFVRRLVVFSSGQAIGPRHAALVDGGPMAQASAEAAQAAEDDLAPYKAAKARTLAEFTRVYMAELLRQTKGNVSEAARVSGIERVSLQKILKRFAIIAEDYR